MDAIHFRLYRLLVEALRERDADLADRPVTVAEIYQELAPYRGVREALGVDLNADYEHALLRLLAGEDDLLRLEPSAARDELRLELESPNPYVGLYRKFAACDVWVKMHQNDRAGTTATTPSTPVTNGEEPMIPEPVQESNAAPLSCTFCSGALPVGRKVRFCPGCGGDQQARPCAKCGEVLDQTWSYCITCGSAVAKPMPISAPAF